MECPDLTLLFPASVRVARGEVRTGLESGIPEEEAAVARAVDKRRNEFYSGRVCAREALRELGEAVCGLPRAEDGRTVWPEGVAGSISHHHQWCGAAVAKEEQVLGIGLDLEEFRRFNRGMAERILTPDEKQALTDRSEEEFLRDATMIFSAKESIFKCLYPVIRHWFGFEDAVIRLEPPEFEIRLAREVESRLPPHGGFRGRVVSSADMVATGLLLFPA